MTLTSFKRAAAAALAVGVLSLAGCGGSTASSEGAVSYDGTPIDMGTVTFIPADGGGQKVGMRFFEGKYSLDAKQGLKPGKYKVEITWLKKTGKKIATGDGAPMDELVEGLPEKYNKATTLSADLKGGVNTVNFEMTK